MGKGFRAERASGVEGRAVGVCLKGVSVYIGGRATLGCTFLQSDLAHRRSKVCDREVQGDKLACVDFRSHLERME